jgi:LPXTG-motif cell wall-anchored protein
VLFNSRPDAITFSDALFNGKNYVLHSIQQNSVDAITKSASFTNDTFNIPARTTSVFVIAESKPVAIAEPAVANSGSNINMIAVLGAVIAIAGIVFLLRRKRKA